MNIFKKMSLFDDIITFINDVNSITIMKLYGILQAWDYKYNYNEYGIKLLYKI